MRLLTITLTLVVAFALSACGDDDAPDAAPTPTEDTSDNDTASDVSSGDGETLDAGQDVSLDTAQETTLADTSSDTGATADAAMDTSPDASDDAAMDTSPDVSADAAMDTSPDVSDDAAMDTSPDVSDDAAMDTSPDVSDDAAMDVMTDTDPTTDADVGAAIDAPVPDAPSDIAASGACMNESDLAQHNSQDIPEKVIATAKECYIAGNTEDADYTSCILSVINDPTGINLTPACTGCYANSALCAKTFCDIECLGPSIDDCATCREEHGCTPGFYECSGLPQAE